MEPKLSRKAAKERTRQRLVQAVLQHVRARGLHDLTTGRVAELAGIAQSSFYVHFADMDEALREAATQAGAEIRKLMKQARRALVLSSPETALRDSWEVIIDTLLAEREFTELVLSHRRDRSSPLGAALRELLDHARADLARDLRATLVGRATAVDIDAYAEVLVGMTLSAVEGILDGRADRESCLRALTDASRGMLAALIDSRREH